MWKFLYFVATMYSILVAARSQPQRAYTSNCVYDEETLGILHRNDWIVVPWEDGQCYFHNIVTRENSDELPSLE